MMRLTLWTCPLPHGERYFGEVVSTPRTGFATGDPNDLRPPYIRMTAGTRPSPYPRSDPLRCDFSTSRLRSDPRWSKRQTRAVASWCIRPDMRNPGMKPGDAPLRVLHGCRPQNAHPFRDRLAGLASICRLNCFDKRRRLRTVAQASGPAFFSQPIRWLVPKCRDPPPPGLVFAVNTGRASISPATPSNQRSAVRETVPSTTRPVNRTALCTRTQPSSECAPFDHFATEGSCGSQPADRSGRPGCR